MLDPANARRRQEQLRQLLTARGLSAIFLGWMPNVYRYSAVLPFWQHHVGLLMLGSGQTVLIAPGTSDVSAVDRWVSYEASFAGTQRQEQPELVARAAAELLRGAKKIGVDSSASSSLVAAGFSGSCVAIDKDLWQFRRQKGPDELALMRRAIRCTEAMYARARQIIEPGVPELTVYNELHATAVEIAGEPLSAYLGNDYACGVPGGPARADHRAAAGQLYILDLGPAYRGYFSDNARTFSVHRHPTDAQHRAWEIVTGVFPIVEGMARPGVRCRDIYRAIDEYYIKKTGKPFPHHLGHGVGLQPHEFPHLNPKWDDVLMEDEVFTCEPGLYSDELAGGMRIENQYRVTNTGVENLTPFPMALV